MSSAPVRVLLAEDHPVYLEGLSAAIGGADDLDLALVCEDGASALDGIRAQRPASRCSTCASRC
jgi:DNA-binding NarL/FixJ family response regulator